MPTDEQRTQRIMKTWAPVLAFPCQSRVCDGRQAGGICTQDGGRIRTTPHKQRIAAAAAGGIVFLNGKPLPPGTTKEQRDELEAARKKTLGYHVRGIAIDEARAHHWTTRGSHGDGMTEPAARALITKRLNQQKLWVERGFYAQSEYRFELSHPDGRVESFDPLPALRPCPRCRTPSHLDTAQLPNGLYKREPCGHQLPLHQHPEPCSHGVSLTLECDKCDRHILPDERRERLETAVSELLPDESAELTEQQRREEAAAHADDLADQAASQADPLEG
jgi:hypothetical protein